MRWRQGVPISGAIAICGVQSDSISIAVSYATEATLHVRALLPVAGLLIGANHQ